AGGGGGGPPGARLSPGATPMTNTKKKPGEGRGGHYPPRVGPPGGRGGAGGAGGARGGGGGGGRGRGPPPGGGALRPGEGRGRAGGDRPGLDRARRPGPAPAGEDVAHRASRGPAPHRDTRGRRLRPPRASLSVRRRAPSRVRRVDARDR